MAMCSGCGKRYSSQGNLLCAKCARPTHCQRCGQRPDNGKLTPVELLLCDRCLDLWSQGRDQSTQIARKSRSVLRDMAEAKRMEVEGAAEAAEDHRHAAAVAQQEVKKLRGTLPPPIVSMGEAVPHHAPWMRDTLLNPEITAMDASAARLDLLLQPGVDVAALAVDAAHSIEAQNSLEKMAAHQLAVLHSGAMRLMNQASRQAQVDPIGQVRMLNSAARLMETFQKGLLTLQRLRTGGQQHVVVQHVQVAPGAQAVIGTVQTGDGKKNEP